MNKLPKDIASISVDDGGGGGGTQVILRNYVLNYSINKMQACIIHLDRWCYLFYIYSSLCVFESKQLLVYFSADLVPLGM